MKAHKTTFKAYGEESSGYDMGSCLRARYIYVATAAAWIFGSVILSGLLVSGASPRAKREIDLYGCRLK